MLNNYLFLQYFKIENYETATCFLMFLIVNLTQTFAQTERFKAALLSNTLELN